jgi:hypothetical protein
MVFVVVLGVLVALQVALISQAPWGRLAWGGQHPVLTTRLRIGSAVSLVLYVGFGVVILDRAHAIDLLAEPVAVAGAWVVFGCMALSAIVNALSRSKPERYTMTPVALTLAVTSFVVAVG